VDLTNPKLIYTKGFLFLLLGLLASALLIVEQPTLKVVVLLAVAVWAFCRFYYFAFYVIQHYVDSNDKFASLWSFGLYLIRKRPTARAGDTKMTESEVTALVGLAEEEARQRVEARGFHWRIMSRDGESYIVTADLRQDRVSAHVEAGKVVAAEIG
jgi:hypothetical protein